MRAYLVQHGEAKSKEEDPSRPLTEKGKEEVTKVAKFLSVRGISVSRIVHSGKLRALQTAEILAEYISPEEGLKEERGLAPLDDPEIWVKRLKEEKEDIMIVGHLPHLQKLSSILLIDDPEKKLIKFRMGGVVCLHRDEKGEWSVEWMIIPDLI